MTLISITVDRLSGRKIHVNPVQVESIQFDRLGENSSSAYAIRMSSGAIIKCDKLDGERILAAVQDQHK
jgi:hypothetical protein